jgi:hypothetical protein
MELDPRSKEDKLLSNPDKFKTSAPLLSQILRQTVNLHKKQSIIIHEGRVEPFNRFDAAFQAITLSNKSANELFDTITSETSLKPTDILAGETEYSQENWDNFRREVVCDIVVQELDNRYPELQLEDEKREERYS